MPLITGLQVTRHALQRVRERLVPNADRDMIRQWLVGKYIKSRKDAHIRKNEGRASELEYNDGGLIFVFTPDPRRPVGTYILITAYIDGDKCDDEPAELGLCESDLSN